MQLAKVLERREVGQRHYGANAPCDEVDGVAMALNLETTLRGAATSDLNVTRPCRVEQAGRDEPKEGSLRRGDSR